VHEREGVTNAVLAERIEGIRRDVSELTDEGRRTRTRLHNLEGFAAAYLDVQRTNRRAEDRQYRRLELRLQVLTVVIACAAVVVPIVVAYLHGK
jgi:hypothetical protein